MSRPSLFERNPRLSIGVVVLAGISVLDVIAGTAYRITAGHAWRYSAYESQRSFRTTSALYHHDLLPNQSVDRVRWGPYLYRMRTNSLGFRDASTRYVASTSEMRRVLFIGDSFTEGIGVDYEDSFVGVIDSVWSHSVDVLNAGVVSYSPVVYWRKLKYLLEERGLSLDEVVVFLDISDIQNETQYYELLQDGTVSAADSADGVTDPGSGHEGVTRYAVGLLNSTILAATAVKLAREILRSFDTSKGQSALWTVDSSLSWRADGIRRARQHMDSLAVLLSRHEVALTVAVYPWPAQILVDDRESIQVTIWDKWSAKWGARFVNLFPPFMAETDKERARIVAKYFQKGDPHWNASGHRLIAKTFLESIRDKP